MDKRLHLFGVRHHGPGSAASLRAALDALAPAIVLIEGPPEAEPLLPHAALPGMKPPLALLCYAAEEPNFSSFFPFAEYSPEWIAIQWALAHQKPIRFIDQPMAVELALQMKERDAMKAALEQMEREPPGSQDDEADSVDEDESDASAALHESEPGGSRSNAPDDEDSDDEPADSRSTRRWPSDPLDMLAEVAGFDDGEAFWSALVESRGAAAEVFPVIEDAMTQLRAETEKQGDQNPHRQLREARREACMRTAIRKALKETEGEIACVVGAWHVPALRAKIPATEDRDTLRDLPKTKVDVCWVPWTEPRLALASGYGAGVVSPGWYRHLWSLYAEGGALEPMIFASRWQARVASALRDAGYSANTASAIEASRLALSLAALRGEATPGLAEMRDSALAALCHGEDAAYTVVEKKLFIGERIGEIDENAPQAPLAADLARQQKKLRLAPQALEQEVSLDLRSEAGLAKSTLLHRLTLLGVHWGRLTESGKSRGTFREIWMLAWQPEFSVRLAEALIYGVTIEQAAGGRARALAEKETNIATLADLVRHCLLADLAVAARDCIARMQAAAVGAADITQLTKAVPPLAEILRYGVARKIPESELRALTHALCVEVNAGLVHACQNLDEDAAAAMTTAVAAYDAALPLIGDDALSEVWLSSLSSLLRSANPAPAIAGIALRRLHDRQSLDIDHVAGEFSRRMSPALPPLAAGQFLEGFLGKEAEVLVHDRPLLTVVDEWIASLDEERFIELLPLLRRALSSFDSNGKRRVMQALQAGEKPVAVSRDGAVLSPNFERARPLLFTILGIDA